MNAELLIDNSAWARIDQPNLPQERAEEIAALFEAGSVATCLPFLLEAGYSARNARAHDALIADLRSLPNVAIDAPAEARALAAQQQLARSGHHRMPPVDLIIAALADIHDLGILHYDGDYDVLLERTDLRFSSVWLAARGSL